MSANADVLQRSDVIGTASREKTWPQVAAVRNTDRWNRENFAREQIRGLVQRVFFARRDWPAKQVVFSAVEPDTDLTNLCDQVAHALSLETRSDIAIVGGHEPLAEMAEPHSRYVANVPIRSWLTQLAINLWRVPEGRLRESEQGSGIARTWGSCLSELRNEFEYAVIHGPSAGISSEAARLGQAADGIVLVLGAHRTRKATARKIKDVLEGAQSRILGTVLSERRFPVPEQIYRRL